jgi:hypothetical protein
MLFWRMIDLNKVRLLSLSSISLNHLSELPSRGNPPRSLLTRLDLDLEILTDISASEHTYTIQEKQ